MIVNWLSTLRARLHKQSRGHAKRRRPRLAIETLEDRLVPAYLGPLLRADNPVLIEDEAFGKAENNTIAAATHIGFTRSQITQAIEDRTFWRTVNGAINSGVKMGDDTTPDVDFYLLGDANGGPTGKIGLFVDLDSRSSRESATLNATVSVVTENGQVLAKNDWGSDLFTGETSDDPALYVDVPAGTRAYVKVEGNGTLGNYTLRTLVDESYDPLASPVVLNSDPTPGLVQLYLDFNGYTVTRGTTTPEQHHLTDKTTWKQFTNRPIDFQGSGFVGDESTFSPGERLYIYRVWQTLAEDYAAFKFNVTTVEPAAFGIAQKKGQRNIIMNGDYGFLATDLQDKPIVDPGASAEQLVKDAAGQVIGPAQVLTGGGWAPVSDPINLGPEVSFSYSAQGGKVDGDSSSARLTSDAVGMGNLVAHEGSHNQGLWHQWHWDATLRDAQGKRLRTSHILNYDPQNNRLLWGGGWVNLKKKQDRTLLQDDLYGFRGLPTTPEGSPFGLGNEPFGFKADDFRNDRANAAVIPRNGSVLSQRGIIEKHDDVDFFTFQANGNTTITVSGLGFKNMTNLDVILKVFDQAGTELATVNPGDSLNATFTIPNAAGTYFVSVQSTGKTMTGTESDGNGQSTPQELFTRLPVYKPDGTIQRDAQDQPVLSDTALEHYTYSQGQFTVVVQTAAGANQTPTLANGPTATLTYTEKNDPLKLFADLRLTDADSPLWNGGRLQVALTSGGMADDRLQIRTDTLVAVNNGELLFNGAKIGTVSGGAGVTALTVQFTANAVDLAVAQEVLRRLAFANVSGNPTAGNRTVALTVTDPQGGASTVLNATVNLVPVNDPPTLVVGTRPNIAATTTLPLGAALLKATDPDTAAAMLTFKVAQIPQRGNLQLSGMTLAQNATFTQADIDAGRLQYVHTGESGVDSMVLTVSDGTTTTAQQPVEIRIKSPFEPVLVKNGPITVRAGETFIITNEFLRFDVPPGSTTDNPIDGWKIAYNDVNAPPVGILGVLTDGGTMDCQFCGNWWQPRIDIYSGPGSNQLDYLYYKAPSAAELQKFINDNKGATSTTFTFKVANEYKNATSDTYTFTINFDTTGLVVPPRTAGRPNVVREDDTNPGGTAVRDIVAGVTGELVMDPFAAPALDRGIAITAIDEEFGTWEYTTDGGATWQLLREVSPSNALVLRDNGELTDLRFIPSVDFDGEAAFLFQMWSQDFWETANPGQVWNEALWQSGSSVDLAAPAFRPAVHLGNFEGKTDVQAVNDAPTFTPGADQELFENAGPVIVFNWTSPLTDDSGSALSYIVDHDISDDHHDREAGLEHDDELEFTVFPQVSPDGTLYFEVAPNSSGSKAFVLYATDGEMLSEPAFFRITVHGVNAAPTIALGGNLQTTAAAGQVVLTGWASDISPGDDQGEEAQGLTLQVTNNNPVLFAEQPSIDPTTGTLTFKPAPGKSGVATVTVTLADNGGGEAPGATTVRTFTITVKPEGSVTSPLPPTVVSVATGRSTRTIRQLLVTFSEDMDAGAVSNPGNYAVHLAGKGKRFGTADDKVVGISSVTFVATRTAQVNLAVPVSQKTFVRLDVLDGITDAGGQRLDGDGDGAAGGDFAASVARGKALSYTDSNGDRVSLKLKGDGQLELWRRGEGEGEELRLLGTFADSSTLSGLVKKSKAGGDLQTMLRRILGVADVISRLPGSVVVTGP